MPGLTGVSRTAGAVFLRVSRFSGRGHQRAGRVTVRGSYGGAGWRGVRLNRRTSRPERQKGCPPKRTSLLLGGCPSRAATRPEPGDERDYWIGDTVPAMANASVGGTPDVSCHTLIEVLVANAR